MNSSVHVVHKAVLGGAQGMLQKAKWEPQGGAPESNNGNMSNHVEQKGVLGESNMGAPGVPESRMLILRGA